MIIKENWRDEYVNKGEFYDAVMLMAKQQSGERQQGILGVLETLKMWRGDRKPTIEETAIPATKKAPDWFTGGMRDDILG